MKRSNQIALLLAGTVAVGGSAYSLMPSENCSPTAGNQPTTTCASRGSGGSGSGSRWGSGGSSWGRGLFSGSSSEAGTVSRGGFGFFGSAFGSARS